MADPFFTPDVLCQNLADAHLEAEVIVARMSF
jgi:hypothetical protein